MQSPLNVPPTDGAPSVYIKLAGLGILKGFRVSQEGRSLLLSCMEEDGRASDQQRAQKHHTLRHKHVCVGRRMLESIPAVKGRRRDCTLDPSHLKKQPQQRPLPLESLSGAVPGAEKVRPLCGAVPGAEETGPLCCTVPSAERNGSLCGAVLGADSKASAIPAASH